MDWKALACIIVAVVACVWYAYAVFNCFHSEYVGCESLRELICVCVIISAILAIVAVVQGIKNLLIAFPVVMLIASIFDILDLMRASYNELLIETVIDILGFVFSLLLFLQWSGKLTE